jgi:hypothetical protein
MILKYFLAIICYFLIIYSFQYLSAHVYNYSLICASFILVFICLLDAGHTLFLKKNVCYIYKNKSNLHVLLIKE